MEHSALHALQLVGLLLALGGPLLVLGLLRPACRTLGPNWEREQFANRLESQVARWVCYGALASALGVLADFFIQAAELKGKTVFNGVSLQLVAHFATQSTVGRLGLGRAAVLAVTGVVARCTGKGRWWWLALLAAVAIVLNSLVSHAAAQPTARVGAVLTQAIHIIAGASWLGVLLQLLAARALLQREAQRPCLALTAEMVRRFSPWALAAVGLLFGSGVLGVCRLVSEPMALLTSAYGLTLLLKLVLLGLALYAGYRNWRSIRPALTRVARGPAGEIQTVEAMAAATPRSGACTPHASLAAGAGVLRDFGRVLELEVTAGLLVVTVAGILGSVSPPGRAGVQRLSRPQTWALLHPHWPRVDIANPATFYGAPDRTQADLQYAEFTHNWSGVAVGVLGLCWLAQSLGGRKGLLAARLWPGLLVLFGVFIGLASDPEVWLLRRLTFWQAVADPQLLEHQLGAGMVFMMAATAWRYQLHRSTDALLGYALPGIMIFGSLLLLGHAHSTLNATQEVTNLINVQHAIFGTFGLLAGTVRWLSLRGLMPQRLAAWLWPGLVFGLGLFMTFGYRETL